jgi:hypothetical protein
MPAKYHELRKAISSMFPITVVDSGVLGSLRRDVQRLSSELQTVRKQRDHAKAQLEVAKSGLRVIAHAAPTPVQAQMARDALMDVERAGR